MKPGRYRLLSNTVEVFEDGSYVLYLGKELIEFGPNICARFPINISHGNFVYLCDNEAITLELED